MRVYGRLILLIVLSFLLVAGCGQNRRTVSDNDEYEEKEYPVSFDTSEVMTEPGDLYVTVKGKEIKARKNVVSWAYAVNDQEWCSVNEEGFESIDGPYDEKFFDVPGDGKIALRFDCIEEPDVLVYVHKYTADYWVEDPSFENDEGSKIKDTIEHLEYYKDFTEMEIPEKGENGFYVADDPEHMKGFIYEVKAVWDKDHFRGSGIYSFMIDVAE